MKNTWLSHVVKAMHANPGHNFEYMLKRANITYKKSGGGKRRTNKASKKTRRRRRRSKSKRRR